MRRFAAVLFLFASTTLLTFAAPPRAYSQDQPPDNNQDNQNQDNQDQGQPPGNQDQNSAYQPFSAEELDNLLSTIALYPDPLLAQTLVAATFPDQVEEAARWVRGNGQRGIDDQDWDISVKAIAHYPSVVEMMADKIDWTTSVGQAYVNQGSDVSAAVQRLRHLAHNLGNLETTPQQEVIVHDEYIAIDPVQPQYIYVPVYDPAICYYRRPYWGPAIVFGTAFPIGGWLNLDFRWGFGGGYGGVFYTGWHPWGGWNDRWISRGRPFVRENSYYVNDRYRNVYVNRRVINRTVHVENIDRYNYIHRDVHYRNVEVNNARANRINNVRGNDVHNDHINVTNRQLNRNIDTNHSRVNEFRGRDNNFGHNDRPPQSQQQRPQQQQEQRQGLQARPDFRRAPNTEPRAQNQGPHTFGHAEGNFDAHASSQRGQASRAQMAQPPRSYSPPSRGGGGERGGGGHPSGGERGGGGHPSGGGHPGGKKP